MSHKGIHSRGYLPHWDFENSVQAITFRLADSLPNQVVFEWKKELGELLTSANIEVTQKAKAELSRRIAKYEDSGDGSCILADSEYAKIVQDALIKDHGKSYKLIDWCIMPNHVHVLIHMIGETSLSNIVKHWKAPTAIVINRLAGRKGSLWMTDYHDRFIRDMDHFYHAKTYIRNNPVKAGLCETAEKWVFSSAGKNWSAAINTPKQ